MFFLFNVKFWYESLIFMDSLFFLCVGGGVGGRGCCVSCFIILIVCYDQFSLTVFHSVQDLRQRNHIFVVARPN